VSNVKSLRAVGSGDEQPPGEDAFIAAARAAITTAQREGATAGILFYGVEDGGVGYVNINANAWQARGLIEAGTIRFNDVQEEIAGD
jgi:hypothetical protein